MRQRILTGRNHYPSINWGRGGGDCSTHKKVLGWNLDTVAQLLCLPPKWQAKLQVAL